MRPVAQKLMPWLVAAFMVLVISLQKMFVLQ